MLLSLTSILYQIHQIPQWRPSVAVLQSSLQHARPLPEVDARGRLPKSASLGKQNAVYGSPFHPSYGLSRSNRLLTHDPQVFISSMFMEIILEFQGIQILELSDRRLFCGRHSIRKFKQDGEFRLHLPHTYIVSILTASARKWLERAHTPTCTTLYVLIQDKWSHLYNNHFIFTMIWPKGIGLSDLITFVEPN